MTDYSFDYLAFENSTSAPEKCTAKDFGDFCARLNVFFYNDPAYAADCGRYRSSPWGNKSTLLLKDDCYLFITKNCDAGSWMEERMSDRFVVLKYSKEHKDSFAKMSEEDIGKITQVVKKDV